MLAAAVALVAAAARLPAQGFEGVMQFVTYENHSETPDTMTQITKGSKIRFEGMGRGGGAMIFDGANRIILMPEQKAYMDFPTDFGEREVAAAASKHMGSAVKTGKTETIAGIRCEDWHFKGTKPDGTPEEGDACIAKNAGLMINRLSGGMAGQYIAAAGPELAEAIRNGAGLMKVTTNGKLSFEAVKAQASSVPDAMFVPPADYKKMDMSGMRKPRHKP